MNEIYASFCNVFPIYKTKPNQNSRYRPNNNNQNKEQNNSNNFGGGIYNTLKFTDQNKEQNNPNNFGGGIYNSLKITDQNKEQNNSNNFGGGIYNSLKITDSINLYKQYEKDKNEKEKNFYKLLEKKGLKNETDFLNIYPSKTMKIYDFQKYFEISDVPKIFLENDDINLFNLIYSYKNYYLGDLKLKNSKSLQ